MCNCNKTALESKSLSSNKNINKPILASNNLFIYIGKTALSLTGGTTLQRYRFEKSGDVNLIDQRDVSGILHIPVLKRV